MPDEHYAYSEAPDDDLSYDILHIHSDGFEDRIAAAQTETLAQAIVDCLNGRLDGDE